MERDARMEERKALHDLNREERKQHLMDRFEQLSDERRLALQERLDAMKEKRTAHKERFADMSPEERKDQIQKIREERRAEREARQNMTPEERQAYIDELRNKAREHRESRVSPYEQMGLGLDPTDIVCAEGKELVIKVSNGLPRCLGPDATVILIDRGVVAYPDGN